MGFATVWVLLFHFGTWGLKVLDPIISVGYGGVDIFIMLSGMGLVFSYKGNKKLFYLKRLLRIIPIYVLMVVINELCSGAFKFSDVLINISCIGYYLPFLHIGYFEWYVPTILLFYILFPFWYDAFEKNRRWGVYAIIISAIMIFAIILFNRRSTIILTITRFPVFFVGCFIGYYIKTHNITSKNTFLARKIVVPIIVGSVVTLVLTMIMVHYCNSEMLWRRGLLWLPFIIITPGFCLLLVSIFDRLPLWICRCCAFIGKMSLEMYLIHIILLNHFSNYFQSICSIEFLSFLFFFCIVCILAYSANKLYEPLRGKLLRLLTASS